MPRGGQVGYAQATVLMHAAAYAAYMTGPQQHERVPRGGRAGAVAGRCGGLQEPHAGGRLVPGGAPGVRGAAPGTWPFTKGGCR